MLRVGNRQGICVVLSSPSGAGKTTISRKLLESDPQVKMSVSCTTRPPRVGEVDGRDYYFVSKDKFKDMINEGAFLEHAEVFGHFYGTPKSFVDEQLNTGKDVVFDIDWQGTRQLAEKMDGDLVSIFILPPSMEELEKRLRARAQDTDEVVQKRMKKASREISHWNEYDYVIVNENLVQAMVDVEKIVQAERLRRIRYPGMEPFVQSLLFGE
jgi:guanylate kinase